MNAPDDVKAVLGMTADTVGKDLLTALLQEMRLLPDVWVKLPKGKQDDIIDRLRDRVTSNVRMAVHLVASQGRTVVVGDLEQITIKDGTKAVIKIGRGAESLHELYDAQGKAVLIVVSDAGDHTGGMDEIHGEADQRGLDLGHEYHDNDGGGMDKHENDRGTTIDGEVPRLPAPSDTGPTAKELDQAFDDGYEAAAAGKPESDCPVISGELVIEWLRGYRTFHAGKNAKGRKA
jgi:ribosome modulation factor